MHGELALRFDYGHIVPWVRRDKHGLHAIAGPDAAYLVTTAPLRGENMHTVSDFTVQAGERVPFVLTWAPSQPGRAPVDAGARAGHPPTASGADGPPSAHEGQYKEAVERSLITLKALTYAPTGGIVAAATTSLPEQLGGPRNWDYRYCWLRDATLTLQALLAAGYTAEAAAWRDWLLRAVAGDPADLQIMYGIHGERRLPEMELPVAGRLRGSSPVRTGNGAAGQLQLDVWGEVLDGLSLTRNSLLKHTDEAWDVQVALMEYLEGAWDQPDNGLWEMRGPRAPLHPLQGDGLGGGGPDGQGRPGLRAARARRPLGGAAGHHPRRCHGPRLRRRSGTPSSSPTAARNWMPACCSSPASGSCRRTIPAWWAPSTPSSGS